MGRNAKTSCRIPLVIGISGSRFATGSSYEALSKALQQELTGLLASYPYTPITVLSNLENDVGTLAGKIAIELRNRYPDRMRLVCPLVTDGDTHATPAVTELLDQADECYALPHGLSSHDDGRQALQSYLCRTSHILFVCQTVTEKPEDHAGIRSLLTERLQGRTIGDCYHQARLNREDYFLPPADLLDEPETGPVLLFGDNKSNPDPYWHFPENSLESEWRRTWQQIDTLNRHLAGSHGDIDFDASGDAALDRMECVHQATSNIAGHFQAIAHRFTMAIGLSAGLAAATFVYADEAGLSPGIWMPVYGFFALLALGAGFLASRFGYQTNHLDYRALSEGLRVQLAWRRAGLHTPASFFYLRKQRKSLAWVRSAIRALAVGSFPSPHDEIVRLQRVRQTWVSDQHAYYESKLQDKPSLHQQLTRNLDFRIRSARWLRNALLVGGATAFVLSLAINFLHLLPASGPWPTTLIILMSFLPSLAVALDYYTGTQAWDKEYTQYERMARAFRKADDFFKMQLNAETTNIDLCHAVLLDLGKEALQEQGDWYQLHSERKINQNVLETTKG